MINYKKIDAAVNECCQVMGDVVTHDDFIGCTLRRVFAETEDYSGNITVAWNCWTEQELDTIITPEINLTSLV